MTSTASRLFCVLSSATVVACTNVFTKPGSYLAYARSRTVDVVALSRHCDRYRLPSPSLSWPDFVSVAFFRAECPATAISCWSVLLVWWYLHVFSFLIFFIIFLSSLSHFDFIAAAIISAAVGLPGPSLLGDRRRVKLSQWIKRLFQQRRQWGPTG